MNDGRARTLEEVGKEFDVTRERIRQIEAKALRKLRRSEPQQKITGLSGLRKRIEYGVIKAIACSCILGNAGQHSSGYRHGSCLYSALFDTGEKAPGAIAMDVNEGPLLRAEEHVRDAGLTEQIRLRRSDGLEQLSPGECDCAVIAGMGGGLMIRDPFGTSGDHEEP